MKKTADLHLLKKIPREVWVLGFVSLLMDISSEMIHSILPLFMVSGLGVTVSTVGILEGFSEATALIVKIFSGTLSDWLGKRKSLTVAGYALGAFSKPFFALANSSGLVYAARLADRVGKGVRGAPRDAMIADVTPENIRGAAFGLRQALDTVGACIGPLAAFGLMLLWAGNFRAVFWVASIPAFFCVILLIFGLHEPKNNNIGKGNNPISRKNMRLLSISFWQVVGIGALFTLSRFSEAFLVLKAAECGVPFAFVPLVMAMMSFVYSASAYPFGKFSDAFSHAKLLGMGLLILIAADFVLAAAFDWRLLILGVCLWGIHMGMTQGLLAVMVAKTAPASLRGTAYGLFNLATGVAMLIASTLAGFLWDKWGSSVTFYAGAFFSLLAYICVRLYGGSEKAAD